MTINPLISIIVPIYNVEEYIEECCLSLVNQTYNNIEIICVDDCTKDNSLKLIENIKSKNSDSCIQIISHKFNMGLACARNTGLKHSKGEYILFVDGDDFLVLNAVELFVNQLRIYGGDIVICNQNILTKSGCKTLNIECSGLSEEYLVQILLRKVNFNISGKLISRKLYENLLFTPELNFGEDYLMYPKLVSRAESISKVDKALYIYNKLNESSYTNNISNKSISQLCQVQLELVIYFKLNGSDIIKKILANSSAQTLVHLIKISYKDIDKLNLLVSFFSSLDLDPHRLSTTDKLLFRLFEKRMFNVLRILCFIGNRL